MKYAVSFVMLLILLQPFTKHANYLLRLWLMVFNNAR